MKTQEKTKDKLGKRAETSDTRQINSLFSFPGQLDDDQFVECNSEKTLNQVDTEKKIFDN